MDYLQIILNGLFTGIGATFGAIIANYINERHIKTKLEKIEKKLKKLNPLNKT